MWMSLTEMLPLPVCRDGKELTTYGVFIFAVIGMLLQSKIGDAGYAMAGLSVAVILLIGVLDFKEIRDAISAPIILMSAGSLVWQTH